MGDTHSQFEGESFDNDGQGEVKTLPLKDKPNVVYGTSGSRGKLNKDFTIERVRRLAQGIADYHNADVKKGVILIGFDPRRGNYQFAKEAADTDENAFAFPIYHERRGITSRWIYHHIQKNLL